MQKQLANAIEGGTSRTPSIALRDVIALAKPRITLMVVITAAGGLFLAGRAGRIDQGPHVFMGEGRGPGAGLVLSTLIGLSMIVAGANALNMYLERDIDRRMDRTKNRPLPAGRMHPRFALWFGVVLSALSVPILAIGANPLTALLAVIANLLYVLAYTPLKQHSQYALHVGAIPGAIPPLLGWTAATASIDAAGIVLFSVLFLWQIPHFVAIALFRKADYARAGLVVTPNVTGDLASRHTIIRWIFALVAASLLVVPLGLAGHGYLIAATVLGAVFFTWGCYGLRAGTGNKWAKSLFGISMVYLVLLFAALALNP
jgi:protoheme IX farnesyltransferase